MHRKTKRFICSAIGLLAIGSGAVVWMIYRYNAPSFPGYHAVNHDWALTLVAKNATAVRRALDQYHHDHAIYPEDDIALAPYLPPNSVSEAHPYFRGWVYFRHMDDPGYSLSCSLGWDAILVCDFDGTKPQWMYEPGDGNPRQPVSLDP